MLFGDWKALKRRWPTLAAEAVVVFLGVYSAFLLDGLRERAADERRREQIVATIAEDCRDAGESLELIRAWFDKTLGGPFLDRYSAGESPPLLPIPLSTGQGAQSWESMLAAGGIDVLDVDLIRTIDRLVSRANQLNAQAESYNDYVRTVLVPNLEGGGDEHYKADTGRLKQKYLWYFYSLQAVRDILGALEDDIAACQAAVG